jgi:hypothetical protein
MYRIFSMRQCVFLKTKENILFRFSRDVHEFMTNSFYYLFNYQRSTRTRARECGSSYLRDTNFFVSTTLYMRSPEDGLHTTLHFVDNLCEKTRKLTTSYWVDSTQAIDPQTTPVRLESQYKDVCQDIFFLAHQGTTLSSKWGSKTAQNTPLNSGLKNQ